MGLADETFFFFFPENTDSSKAWLLIISCICLLKFLLGNFLGPEKKKEETAV